MGAESPRRMGQASWTSGTRRKKITTIMRRSASIGKEQKTPPAVDKNAWNHSDGCYQWEEPCFLEVVKVHSQWREGSLHRKRQGCSLRLCEKLLGKAGKNGCEKGKPQGKGETTLFLASANIAAIGSLPELVPHERGIIRRPQEG